MPVRCSTWRNSKPPSVVMAPPSKRATTSRRKGRPNSKLVWVHSVVEGLSASCGSNIFLINVLCHSLELEIEDILFRPPGRPNAKPLVRYKSFRYQAESWSKARRVVAKVEHHQGELFPRVGFVVTSMTLPSRSVVRFYNKRGTAEQWIKEGKQATHWTRLSCHRFRANEVRLQLSVLAYNLGNLWRRLGLPHRIKSWSLTSLQHRLMKTGGRLVKHARYYWLLLAEGHLNRRLFGDMLHRIWALPVPGG